MVDDKNMQQFADRQFIGRAQTWGKSITTIMESLPQSETSMSEHDHDMLVGTVIIELEKACSNGWDYKIIVLFP